MGERYFYLIVFAMYIRELGPKGFPQTFKQYMDEHSGLRTMIEEGRSKLEWERKIPDEKLSELKEMLSAADFKANMPKVIKRIYELSGTCSETFQGDTTRTTPCTNLLLRP